MNILSIGNSFSQDAQRYLHQIAMADGVDIRSFNLYIAGCPLSRHYRNMLSKERVYMLEMNGNSTGFSVSLKEALLNRDWDVITVQQVSSQSPNYDTYQPYLDGLVEYIRRLVPKARIAVHQTWAYHNDSPRLETMGFKNSAEMFEKVEDAYNKMAEYIKADGIIPSGKLIQKLFDAGINHTHRDNHHISLGISRYAVVLLWYGMLVNKDIDNVPFNDFDEEVTEEEIALAKKLVKELI